MFLYHLNNPSKLFNFMEKLISNDNTNNNNNHNANISKNFEFSETISNMIVFTASKVLKITGLVGQSYLDKIKNTLNKMIEYFPISLYQWRTTP